MPKILRPRCAKPSIEDPSCRRSGRGERRRGAHRDVESSTSAHLRLRETACRRRIKASAWTPGRATDKNGPMRCQRCAGRRRRLRMPATRCPRLALPTFNGLQTASAIMSRSRRRSPPRARPSPCGAGRAPPSPAPPRRSGRAGAGADPTRSSPRSTAIADHRSATSRSPPRTSASELAQRPGRRSSATCSIDCARQPEAAGAKAARDAEPRPDAPEFAAPARFLTRPGAAATSTCRAARS